MHRNNLVEGRSWVSRGSGCITDTNRFLNAMGLALHENINFMECVPDDDSEDEFLLFERNGTFYVVTKWLQTSRIG